MLLEQATGNLTFGFNTSSGSLSLEWIRNHYIQHKMRIYIPAIVYTATLMLTGLIGNTIVWIVYYYKWKACSTRIFILSLATCDLINCIISMPSEITLMVDYSIFTFSALCKTSRFSTYMCNSTSTLVLIAVAFDRFQRICKPYKNVMSSGKAKYIVILLIAIAFLLTWPSLILYGQQTISIYEGKLNFSVQICLIEDRFVQTAFPLSYFGLHAVGTIVTFIIMIVLYSYIGINVHRHWNYVNKLTVVSRGKTMKNNQIDSVGNDLITVSNMSTPIFKRKHKTTVILCLVSFAYILSTIPFLSLVIHRRLFPGSWTQLSDASEMVYNVFIRSYLLNCAINPLIYSLFNKKFRTCCQNIFKHGIFQLCQRRR